MRRASRTTDSLSRLMPAIDGVELVEQWIEPDPWSWCYRRPRAVATNIVWTA